MDICVISISWLLYSAAMNFGMYTFFWIIGLGVVILYLKMFTTLLTTWGPLIILILYYCIRKIFGIPLECSLPMHYGYFVWVFHSWTKTDNALSSFLALTICAVVEFAIHLGRKRNPSSNLVVGKVRVGSHLASIGLVLFLELAWHLTPGWAAWDGMFHGLISPLRFVPCLRI